MLIFSLAKETGWSEAELLWEIPCHRVNAYWHACLRSHDIWTVALSEPVEDYVLRLEGMVTGPLFSLSAEQEEIPDLF